MYRVKITEAQFKRTVKELEKHAGEKATEVRFFDSTFYFFGSEIATLRLLKAYRDTKEATAGYSSNLRMFYFSLGTPSFTGVMSTKDGE